MGRFHGVTGNEEHGPTPGRRGATGRAVEGRTRRPDPCRESDLTSHRASRERTATRNATEAAPRIRPLALGGGLPARALLAKGAP